MAAAVQGVVLQVQLEGCHGRNGGSMGNPSGTIHSTTVSTAGTAGTAAPKVEFVLYASFPMLKEPSILYELNLLHA